MHLILVVVKAKLQHEQLCIKPACTRVFYSEVGVLLEKEIRGMVQKHGCSQKF